MARKSVTQQSRKNAGNIGPKRAEPFVTDPFVRSLLKKVIGEAKKPDDAMIHAAKEVKKLRTYVTEKGWMGRMTWYEWAPVALKGIGDENKLRLLNELAEAPLEDARVILAAHRRDGAKRTRMSRERAKQKLAANKKKLALERQWIIRWAKQARLQDVAKAWKTIKRVFDA